MPWVLNATPEVDAQSQYPTIIAICTVLSVLTILIVGARLKIRYKNRGLAADDYMAALAVVFAVTYSVLCIVRTCHSSIQTPFSALLMMNSTEN